LACTFSYGSGGCESFGPKSTPDIVLRLESREGDPQRTLSINKNDFGGHIAESGDPCAWNDYAPPAAFGADPKEGSLSKGE
jgi:hypothetical protein